MRVSRIIEIFLFFIGFIGGTLIYFGISPSSRDHTVVHQKIRQFLRPTNAETSEPPKQYDSALADRLAKEIRVLCWVFTHPDNHKKKVPHVRTTWGKKCNKLLFVSIKSDPNDPDIIAMPVENGRAHLWNKTRLLMRYVYEHHRDDADWFMRADDDNFIVMENLRYTLAQYHPQMSLYIGHRFAILGDRIKEGYMAGGGHIFSRKALEKFVTWIEPNGTLCPQDDSEFDDVLVGECLRHHAVFLDARDSRNQKQIFPVGVEEHMHRREPDMSYWYWRNLWRNVTQGGLDCCSDVYIGAHYVAPKELYMLEYLVYHVHPFGVQKNLTEELPRKLTMDEIVKASDAISYSPNFQPHEIKHFFEEDEKYRRRRRRRK